jgi:hypothetical protein
MVIVYKVQVLLHQDGGYGKNAATGITNGGFYRGGALSAQSMTQAQVSCQKVVWHNIT